ncbi:HipA domain-containing protein [Flavobacterium sp.]|uniref:HipA domain-containing protein n=1 Tax=Flavobacterium sp. TaxID=239 RepID=UPI00333F87D3
MAKLIKYKIVNQSGLKLQPRDIPVLKKNNYTTNNDSVGGDAPKNVINVYEYGKVKKAKPSKWTKYIAKIGHKWYPNESITEQLLTDLGKCFSISIANSKLVFAENYIRFLSEHFHTNEQILEHGADILSSYMNEEGTAWIDDLDRQKKLKDDVNILDVINAITCIYKQDADCILNSFFHMLLFDAFTGNNDRHYYNWGVISHIKNKHKPNFSPVYHSARGLFWNKSDKNVVYLHQELNNPNNKQLDKYVLSSVPKISIPNNSKCNHFDLIKYLKANNYLNEEHVAIWSNKENLSNCVNLLGTKFDKLFINERKSLIQIVLEKRFNLLEQILK